MDGIGRVVSGTKTEQLPKDLKPRTLLLAFPQNLPQNELVL